MRARMSVARGPHCGSIVSADLWRWANEEAKIQNISGKTPHKAINSSFANWRQDSGLRIARWGRLESFPVTCVASTPGPNGLEHHPEKACPDLIRGGIRFSEKIMLKQKARAGCRSNHNSSRSRGLECVNLTVRRGLSHSL